MRYSLFLGLICMAFAGCQQSLVCTQELGITFGPPDTVIAIAQQFRARLEFTSCGGHQRWSGSPVWHSQEPAIASVDSASGLVSGKSVGQTLILGHDPYEQVDGTLRVTVR